MRRWLEIGLLLLSIHARAAVGNSETVFDTLKTLQGNWAIQSEGKTLPIQMVYQVGSKSSIVTEQFGKELSVFYRDGNDVLMTHFCNGGNQPRLRLKQNSQAGVLEFEMFDITNLKDAEAPHVQRIIYRLTGEKEMKLEIVWKNGHGEESEKYILTRL